MGILSRLVAAALALLPTAADAATPQDNDALIRLCHEELAGRMSGGAAQGETFVVAQSIQREGERVSIRLEIASGEGRHIAATSVFRNGKLFDVKE